MNKILYFKNFSPLPLEGMTMGNNENLNFDIRV